MRKRTLLLLLILIVVTGTVAAVLIIPLLQPEPTPLATLSGELAFISDREGKWDVFVMDTEGTLRNLTADGDGHDYFASWSFDGEMVNFLTSRTGEMGPGQVRPDGSQLRTLSIAEGIMTVFLEGRFDWDPNWSPGGGNLLWASLRDRNLELYVAPVDDLENRTRLTHDSLLGPRDWFPAWSPDGRQIIYTSDRDGNENVYRIDANGQNPVQLTDNPADDLRPVWSLEGDKILFISQRNTSLTTGQIDFFLMNPDGSDERPLDEGEVFQGSPMYSANGSQVAFISNEEGNWNIYVMDASGENIRRLTENDANDLFPVWRPVPATANTEE